MLVWDRLRGFGSAVLNVVVHALVEACELSGLSSNQPGLMRKHSIQISLSLFLLAPVGFSVKGIKLD